jgi:hypothetical protein
MPGKSDAASAAQTPVDAPPSSEVSWLGQFSIPEERLRQIATNGCQAMELMQFVRAPFAAQLGGDWVLGDLRFDRGEKTGMAQVVTHPLARGSCALNAPWLPPRADLLEPAR